jgi:hypothetical protein
MFARYHKAVVNEYNEILDSYMKGVKTQGKHINARRVFLSPLVNTFTELKEKYKEMEELKLVSSTPHHERDSNSQL